MQIKDPREQDIFCSLLTRKDGMQELAEKYGLSAKELASMYERSVEEIMDDWDAMAQERQELQEQLMLELIKGNWASVALGEATAKAVQRIPDAHCNGDMHAALDYASQIKHEQKEFLTKRGIHAILGSDEAA